MSKLLATPKKVKGDYFLLWDVKNGSIKLKIIKDGLDQEASLKFTGASDSITRLPACQIYAEITGDAILSVSKL